MYLHGTVIDIYFKLVCVSLSFALEAMIINIFLLR